MTAVAYRRAMGENYRDVSLPPKEVLGGLAYNLIPCDREQQFLLPPSLEDWLPADHLARFVIDVDDEPGQMVGGEPVLETGREQELLFAIARDEVVGHPGPPSGEGLHPCNSPPWRAWMRSEEHTSELQSRGQLVCRLLLEKKKQMT